MKEGDGANSGQPRPPTMEDIARVLGVHRTTVSLALRNHPRIPERTRKRVREAVEELGYRPHPLVSALMSYRANHRKLTWKGTLGVITAGTTKDNWQSPVAYKLMYEGAHRRARELGYDLNTFWALDPDMPVRKFNTMLRARNVPGVIVFPLFSDPLPDIDWSIMSAVAIGHSMQQPDLHRVTNDYFHSMMMAVQKCLEKGFRRIAYVQDQRTEERVDYLWRSAFLMQQAVHRNMGKIKPLVTSYGIGQQDVERWLLKEKPDVVISLPASMVVKVIKQMNPIHPIQHVNLGIYDRQGEEVGIFQDYPKIGAAAVDFLTAMINRGERGIPEQSHALQIKSIWVE